MKLFWKFFFSTSIISLFMFGLGSSIMINTLFQSSLKQEINYSFNENDILQTALNNELTRIYQNTNTSNTDKEAVSSFTIESADRLMKSALTKIAVSTSNGVIPFQISNSNYITIYTTSSQNYDNKLIKVLNNGTRAYEVTSLDNRYYIRVACPILFAGENYYLETYKDITALFQIRENQFQIFFYSVIGIIGFSFILILFVAYWLTKPLKELAKSAIRISKGDYDLPVLQEGYDEIGLLTRAFNQMSTSLKQTMAELEASALRQENFIASFAHELKTPMTSIIGYADMLRSKKVNQEQMILYSNNIFKESKRLEALSFKLMELIVLKKHEFQLKTVSASHFFETVQSVITPILKRDKIEFVTKVAEMNLQLEPDLMKTVCLNLLDNARKSIDANGRIHFLGNVEKDGYCITIADNGKGIESDEISKITEAFYMSDKSRSRATGSVGLGLTICSQIVEIHHAKMVIESVPEKGTCIYIHLKESKPNENI